MPGRESEKKANIKMERCSHKPRNPNSHQNLEEAREESPLKLLEGVQLCHHLAFRLLEGWICLQQEQREELRQTH